MNPFSLLRSTWVVALVLSMGLVLGACQSVPSMDNILGSSSTQSADPRLTQNDQARFFSKSGWQACLVAAGAGAMACQMGNPSNKDDCMLKAALVACGVAMGANYYLDQRRAEYSNNEQRLDAMINDVREDNRKLASLNQTARSVIADDRTQIDQLKKDIAANKVQTVQAQKQLAEIDANTQYLRKTLADLKAREKQWNEVAANERASGANTKDLDTEISRMQQQVASLEKEIDTLFQQRSAIKIG